MGYIARALADNKVLPLITVPMSPRASPAQRIDWVIWEKRRPVAAPERSHLGCSSLDEGRGDVIIMAGDTGVDLSDRWAKLEQKRAAGTQRPHLMRVRH